MLEKRNRLRGVVDNELNGGDSLRDDSVLHCLDCISDICQAATDQISCLFGLVSTMNSSLI